MVNGNSARRALAALIVLLALALTVVVVMNYRGSGPEEMLASLPENVDLSLQKINYTETDNGDVRWKLKADAAQFQSKSETTQIENIEMTLFDRGSFGDIRITAQEGLLDTAQGTVEVWGDVILKATGDRVYRTERVMYDDRERTLHSPGPVHFSSPGLTFSGTGMHLETEPVRLEVLSDVKARFQAVREDVR